MIRIVIMAAIVAGGYYLLKEFVLNSKYISCEKCDGKGYWIATRGEREKCDACGGAGKWLRQEGEK